MLDVIGNPEDMFSRAAAQIVSMHELRNTAVTVNVKTKSLFFVVLQDHLLSIARQ